MWMVIKMTGTTTDCKGVFRSHPMTSSHVPATAREIFFFPFVFFLTIIFQVLSSNAQLHKAARNIFGQTGCITFTCSWMYEFAIHCFVSETKVKTPSMCSDRIVEIKSLANSLRGWAEQQHTPKHSHSCLLLLDVQLVRWQSYLLGFHKAKYVFINRWRNNSM